MLRIIPVGVKVDITCSKCAFWVPSDCDKQGGECHRHAPMDGFDRFPMTSDVSWCGDCAALPKEAEDD